MIKIYDSEKPKEGWVVVDGTIEDARKVARARLYEYDRLDCDTSWTSFVAIADGDEVVEALIGDYDSWLFNPARQEAAIYPVPKADFAGEGISIPLHPRKDYIL